MSLVLLSTEYNIMSLFVARDQLLLYIQSSVNIDQFIGLVGSGFGEFSSQGGPDIGEFPRETIDHENTEEEVR